MKPTPLLIAALLPFTASAAGQGMDNQKVNQQELKDDLQVTHILGAEVQSSDGRELGNVEDIILSSDGSISSVLVQREGDLSDVAAEAGQTAENAWDETEAAAEDAWNSAERNTEQAANEAERSMEDAAGEGEDVDYADAGAEDSDHMGDSEDGDFTEASEGDQQGMDMGMDPDRADTLEMGDEFSQLQWSDVSFDPETEVLQLKGDATSMQSVTYDQTSDMQLSGKVRASKLVGLEVNLADEDSFGEVEDVMIDPKEGKATAIVVDSMEFFDKERYALPVNLDAINTEEEELTLQMTQQQVEDMGEFDMEGNED